MRALPSSGRRITPQTHLVFVFWVFVVTPTAVAQPSAGLQPSTRVYIDCAANTCDQDFIRTELQFVEHVRDRQLADVHLLVSEQVTGTGGTEVTFSYFGQGRFTGRDHVLKETFAVATSDDDLRRGMLRAMSLGLVPYVLDTEAARQLEIGNALQRVEAPEVDPWNRWSVRFNVSASANGEESTQSAVASADVNANRTTDATKVNVNLSFNYRESRFDLPDGRTVVAPSRDRGVDALFVKSVNARWSAGMRAEWGESSFRNQDWTAFAGPAIEWNLFPYAESTRRLLTFNYSIGARAWDYQRETIFGKLEEVRTVHALETTVALRQRWGTVASTLEVASFLPDTDKYHVSLFGNAAFNLARGLAVTVSTSVEAIRDQITLPRESATAEEVLVSVRQLATSHRYLGLIGISYTFGSIFSPIVNPRMGGER